MLLTLLGTSSICYNQWSLSAEENLAEMETLLTNLDQAKAFSACLEKKQEEVIKEEQDKEENEKEEELEKKAGVTLVN